MFEFFVFLLIISIISCIILYYRNKDIEKKYAWISIALIIVSLVGITFYLVPNYHSDLYKHYSYISNMRKYGFFTINKEYDLLIVIKTVFYIISLQNNNIILPILSLLLCFSISIYQIISYDKKNKCSTRTIIASLFIIFILITLQSIVSGIRTAMSMSIITIPLRRIIITKKIDYKSIIFVLLAFLIHPISLMPIIIYIIYKNFIRKIEFRNKIIIIFLFNMVIKIIGFLLKNVKCNFYFFNKIISYLNNNWIDDIRLYLLMIVEAIALIWLFNIILKRVKEKEENKLELEYIKYLQIYLSFMIGIGLVAKIFVKRMIMLYAFYSIPSVHIIEDLPPKNKKIIYIVIILLFMLMVYYSYKEITGNMNFIY